MEKFYEILVNDFKDKQGHSKYIGLSFATEELAKEFIDTFLKPVERSFYSIREREISPLYKNIRQIYNSMEELLKVQPGLEINKLEVERKVLLSSVTIPFEIPFTVINSKNQATTTKISTLSYFELKKFINYVSVKVDKLLRDNTYTIDSSYMIKFKIFNFNHKEQVAFGQITYGDYQTAQTILNAVNEKIQKMDKKLISVKDSLKTKKKEDSSIDNENDI